jgi:hypothetical protein
VKRFAILLGCALLAAACNNTGYSRATVVEDLRAQTQLTDAQADCLSKRLEQVIDVRRLGARDEPTPFERVEFRAALLYAIVACSGAPYDRDRVATALNEELDIPFAESECITRAVEQRVKPDTLARDDNLSNARVAEIRAAIVEASLACGGEAKVRRNVGLTRQQAECVLDAPEEERADAIAQCEKNNS